MDTTQFGGTFWITISGMTLGFLATTGIYCLKAKCNQVSLCWGLIKIQRDVEAEVTEDDNEINHGMNPYQFQTQNFIPTNTSLITNNPTNNPITNPTTNPTTNPITNPTTNPTTNPITNTNATSTINSTTNPIINSIINPTTTTTNSNSAPATNISHVPEPINNV
jgi:hypothetical protein